MQLPRCARYDVWPVTPILAFLRQGGRDNGKGGSVAAALSLLPAPGGEAELEFVSASEGENLEDQLTYLHEPSDVPDVRDISFRLLRHYASSVRHQKYHGVDVVSVQVAGPR